MHFKSASLEFLRHPQHVAARQKVWTLHLVGLGQNVWTTHRLVFVGEPEGLLKPGGVSTHAPLGQVVKWPMFEVLIRESPCTVAMHVLFCECPGTVDRPFTAVRAARPTAAASVTSPPCGAPLPPTCAPGHPAALRRRRRREREVLSALTGRVQGGRTRKTGKGRRPFFKKEHDSGCFSWV